MKYLIVLFFFPAFLCSSQVIDLNKIQEEKKKESINTSKVSISLGFGTETLISNDSVQRFNSTMWYGPEGDWMTYPMHEFVDSTPAFRWNPQINLGLRYALSKKINFGLNGNLLYNSKTKQTALSGPSSQSQPTLFDEEFTRFSSRVNLQMDYKFFETERISMLIGFQKGFVFMSTEHNQNISFTSTTASYTSQYSSEAYYNSGYLAPLVGMEFHLYNNFTLQFLCQYTIPYLNGGRETSRSESELVSTSGDIITYSSEEELNRDAFKFVNTPSIGLNMNIIYGF